jgi:hypothetical protein
MAKSVTIYGEDIHIARLDATKKLDTLVSQTANVIFEAKNVFPFDLFVDKLLIRPTKIDVVYGIFFFSDHVMSMLIKDLKAVKLTTGIFFASLQFELQGYEENPPEIKFLWREDAMKARRIISGLMAAQQNGVDLTQLPVDQLMEKTEEIGRAREE